MSRTSGRTVSAGREKDQLTRCPITATPTSPPGGVLRRIRLLEYVRARRYATTGRIGSGLHRTTRAVLRSIASWMDSTEHLMGASSRPDLVGPGRLTCYAIGTTASADPRGIFLPAQHWDGSQGKVICHSIRRATRPFRGAGLSSGSVRWRTRKRTTAGGPSGAMDT
jgi:hypothetical protein